MSHDQEPTIDQLKATLQRRMAEAAAHRAAEKAKRVKARLKFHQEAGPICQAPDAELIAEKGFREGDLVELTGFTGDGRRVLTHWRVVRVLEKPKSGDPKKNRRLRRIEAAKARRGA